MKKYKVGFYGGKFMPFHKGHEYCISKGLELCETLYVIMFYGGKQEKDILNNNNEEYLLPDIRYERIKEHYKNNTNIKLYKLDISNCRLDSGEENWEAETPLVRNIIKEPIDIVLGSEVSYTEYFNNAYPEAKYIIVDKERNIIPISATKIRNMNEEERIKWII